MTNQNELLSICVFCGEKYLFTKSHFCKKGSDSRKQVADLAEKLFYSSHWADINEDDGGFGKCKEVAEKFIEAREKYLEKRDA